MSTRVERLRRTEERAKARLAADRQRLLRVQAAQRAEAYKTRIHRQHRVGAMVAQAGLFVLDDPTIWGLVQCLATLVEVPNPVAVLGGRRQLPAPYNLRVLPVN